MTRLGTRPIRSLGGILLAGSLASVADAADRSQTDLRFVGDWGLWAAIGLALALAALAWVLYHREARRLSGRLPWLLPALRAVAVLLLVLMLAGPVLHHRRVIGELARVLVFVDASQSMGTADEFMTPGRKLLVARSLGWLAEEEFDAAGHEAAGSLARAQAIARRGDLPPADVTAETPRIEVLFAKEIERTHDQLKRQHPPAAELPGATDAWPARDARDELLDRFQDELLKPSQQLARPKPGADPAPAATELARLAEVAGRWEKELRERFDRYASSLVATNDPAIAQAVQKLDATPRWQRLEAMLFDERVGVLAPLAERHHVELLALSGAEARVLWHSQRETELPAKLEGDPQGTTTDLSDGIQGRLGERSAERVAVVLLSDGRQNDGTSPIETARLLGQRRIPEFTVGLGGENRPNDLAVVAVEGPELVYIEDQARGTVVLQDHMPVGVPFVLKIEHAGRTCWEQSLVTEQTGLRQVDFDFPVKPLVQAAEKSVPDLEFMTMPLALKVSVAPLEGEKEKDNNARTWRFRSMTHRRRMLVLEGRPRWEYRYLRNLFERDQEWEINDVLAWDAATTPLRRGSGPGMFPPTREALFAYDLIIFGELPPDLLNLAELEALRDFVSQRGGGIILIDGQRGFLRDYATGPLGALFPVTWLGDAAATKPAMLRLTGRGEDLGPLRLITDPVQNARLWRQLPSPHWVAPVKALPGTEVLVEAVAGPEARPAVVLRQFGAGKVFYAAFDESWRWRYEVAGKYHEPYWNQLAAWIMEAPYAVRDRHVTFDAGPLNYAPGDAAEIRVRLRDAEGLPVLRADARAILYREGRKYATIPLRPDENQGGIFRGKTGALAEGDYEVAVIAEELTAGESPARIEFHVVARDAGELNELNCDEELLQQVARLSGGEYFREEEVGRLAERLAPFSQGKVVESDTVLWQSWWWFVPIILLLGVEWFLRKQAGML